ncbi:MAG: Gfo/Idh/MocA family oxidoreductase [Fuerstiella sp.]
MVKPSSCLPTPGTVSRRNFTAISAGAFAAAALPHGAFGRPPASERITLGVIGLGSRGFNLLDAFLAQPDCQIVAVCDVDQLHYRDREWGSGKTFGRRPAAEHVSRAYQKDKSGTPAGGLQVSSDYREVMARSDIDAVVVATPDHWHALCTLEALRAGKDVYCEKPVTHLFAEGQAVVAEIAKRKAVFQTGSQQRSDPLFHRVVELAQNGILGELRSFEVGLPPGYDKPQGSTAIETPREDLDYDFWCGPSVVLPLMQARHHRWWRGHRAYGGGVLMDWIGHHNDIAHWAIQSHRSGPTLVEAVEWQFPDTDVYNTPQHYTIRCEYDGGITSTISSRNSLGVKIIGSEGWVFARRGKIEASNPGWLAKDFVPGGINVGRGTSHAADFLQHIRRRGECIAPAEVAHRSITPGHLGYVSHALQKPLHWDSKAETVTNVPEANAILKQVTYRTPWKWHGPTAG